MDTFRLFTDDFSFQFGDFAASWSTSAEERHRIGYPGGCIRRPRPSGFSTFYEDETSEVSIDRGGDAMAIVRR